jgi:type VI secretion system protein ImpL
MGLCFMVMAGIFYFGQDDLETAAYYLGFFLAVLMLVALLAWLLRKLYKYSREKWAGRAIDEAAYAVAGKPIKAQVAVSHNDVDVVNKRMLNAINILKASKLGFDSKAKAVYKLPWYMIIGNPAAGKSSAIEHSGLQFPFSDKAGTPMQGIGGTRNIDWFFTADGILLDTAGRYTAHEEDSEEWLGFLALLKKHRRLAPINGILIAVSITDLMANKPEFSINLAKTFRERIQELTERLEILAPVYIIFTKADTLAGFNEFFSDAERAEKDRVWGATIPYNLKNSSQDILDFFDQCFDELYEGLKQLSLAKMAMKHGGAMSPGIFTFPLEFLAIKNPLVVFISTLFEDNPYQFKPVFRGFYFTSALQEEDAISASSERVAKRFNLNLTGMETPSIATNHGYFLKDLFKKVIFADKNLVAQFNSRSKIQLRYAGFLAASVVLGLSLAAWSWSYASNLELTANVQADLDKIIKLQAINLDLKSRLEALDVLQDRLKQLEKYHHERPWSLGFGLYQGDKLEAKIRAEYFSGVNELMLKPVSANLEKFLNDVNVASSQLKPNLSTAVKAESAALAPNPYKDLSPASVEDAYNALKTYLMLADRSRAEAGHLNDQLTRFWRTWLDANRGTMSRDDMIRSAESIISFYLTEIEHPTWPIIDNKLSLIDQTRDNLRRVINGMPARERIYADIKARAATRFPSVTVARLVGDQDSKLIAGSYVVPGTFTKAAWQSFIAESFKNVANKELQSSDWVLKTASKDDLTLEGSPEQIQKSLIDTYKLEYSKEWQKFIQGVVINDFGDFNNAVNVLNRLGDPESSPINKLVNTVYDETSWDNPSLVNAGLQRAHRGFIDWFKQVVLRQKPASLDVNLDIKNTSSEIPMGPVGRDFAGIAKLVVANNNDASLMRNYMANLSKLRSRFNQLKNQGDAGPGSKQLMQQTLDGNGSELADTLKFVDEQMLVGMADSQKQVLRPILVRPLMQAFEVIIKPTAYEMNKTWQAQVYNPFRNTLAQKYPFSANSRIEASNAEIGQIFGNDGAIAKFFNTAMGPLVVRRGDTLAAKTWADMGAMLAPAVLQNFTSWVAPLSAAGVPSAASAGGDQWVFQLLPHAAAGVTEYMIEIDGQQLRYRNTQALWTNFVWPQTQGVPGARISATNFAGQSVEIVNLPGRFGFKRLIDSASKNNNADGIFELTWSNGGLSITAELKIISKPDANSGSNPQGSGFRGLSLPENVLNTNLTFVEATAIGIGK